MNLQIRDRVVVVDPDSPFHGWIGRIQHLNIPSEGYHKIGWFGWPDGWAGVSLTFSEKQIKLFERADAPTDAVPRERAIGQIL